MCTTRAPQQRGLTGPSSSLAALANVDAEERAGSFQDAASDEHNWQSDEEDGDAEEQREIPAAPRTATRAPVGMFARRESGPRHVDDVCHGQALARILGRRRGRSEGVSGLWPNDAQGSTTEDRSRKRVREDLVEGPLSGKTGLSSAGFINDPADSYDGRDDGCDAVRDIRLRFLSGA